MIPKKIDNLLSKLYAEIEKLEPEPSEDSLISHALQYLADFADCVESHILSKGQGNG